MSAPPGQTLVAKYIFRRMLAFANKRSQNTVNDNLTTLKFERGETACDTNNPTLSKNAANVPRCLRCTWRICGVFCLHGLTQPVGNGLPRMAEHYIANCIRLSPLWQK